MFDFERCDTLLITLAMIVGFVCMPACMHAQADVRFAVNSRASFPHVPVQKAIANYCRLM